MLNLYNQKHAPMFDVFPPEEFLGSKHVERSSVLVACLPVALTSASAGDRVYWYFEKCVVTL